MNNDGDTENKNPRMKERTAINKMKKIWHTIMTVSMNNFDSKIESSGVTEHAPQHKNN